VADALGLQRSPWFAVTFERRRGNGNGHAADSFAEALELLRLARRPST
jgi:hypothetical protein